MSNTRLGIAVTMLVCIAAFVWLAVIASAASPRPGTLRGHIERSGHAKLQIRYQRKFHRRPPPSREARRLRIRDYTWHLYRVPLKCKGGPAIARYTVKGGEAIVNKYAGRGDFGGGDFEGGKRRFREYVQGKLINPNKAKGWVRVAGTHVPVRGGGTEKCDSGRLHWTVSR